MTKYVIDIGASKVFRVDPKSGKLIEHCDVQIYQDEIIFETSGGNFPASEEAAFSLKPPFDITPVPRIRLTDHQIEATNRLKLDITAIIDRVKTFVVDAPKEVKPMKNEGLPAPKEHKGGRPSTYKPCPNGPPRCGSKRRRQWK